MKPIYIIILFSLAACNFSTQPEKSQAAWSFKEFVKVDSANPILIPDTSFYFDCPVSHQKVKWQSKNVLNPTAFVKDGKVIITSEFDLLLLELKK